jgi:hypothetical protein
MIRFLLNLSVRSGLLLLGTAALLPGATATVPALRAKVVAAGQPVSASHQPILALPPSGPASATLVAEAFQFTPTNYVWSQVLPVSSHLHAAKAAVTFGATSTTVSQTSVSFPERGIYELQVVATNGTTSAFHSIWIQVWDRLSGLNPLQQIGRNPGIAPPTSVRQLSPDPGPYQHPRLLFTAADWPELNAKTTASTDVASSLTSLQTSLNNNFDKSNGSLRLYADALVTWSNGGFGSSAYTSNVAPVYSFAASSILCRDPGGKMPDALLAASYLAWVRSDPALAQSVVPTADQTRFRYLAQVAAAAARAEITRAEIGATATPPVTPTAAHDMAVVYDLLYDWMTEAQRTDFRDYLYAIGYGYYNTGGGGIARGVQPTYLANGDFPNLADAVTLSALVIEGEEASVSPSIIAIHGPTAPVATGPDAWPHASPASVWNTYRMARWYSEFFITPWGSPLNHQAYLELSTGSSAGAMLALARRGQNIFVTSNLYQASLHAFNNLNPRPSDGNMVLWDHHDSMGFSNGPNAYAGRYITRYMFPDDPLMDYVYSSFRRENNNPFLTAVFHVDRVTPSLAAVADAKQAALTRFDPFRGAAVTRNSWAENDLSLYFECRPDVQNHMHAEANNFSLYALGRAWASPPGYHVTVNDAASTVLTQDPTLTADPATQGYIGQSASSATTTTTRGQFPTPPAKFLEATEDPGGHWALFAGDATSAYQYAFERNGTNVNTGRRLASYYYGESRAQLYAGYDATADNATLSASNLAYNPVQYALRSTLTVRGSRPYVLVIDDITTDGVTPRNFRWNMPAAVSFGGSGGRYVNALNQDVYSSMRIQAGSTATDAVLFHEADAASGPRLLVRDLTEQSTSGQPSIFLDTRPSDSPSGALTYGYDNNSGTFTNFSSNRLLIPRLNVVSPKFKVLLFPHQSSELTPLTSWNAEQTIATIDLRNTFTDRLTLDSTRADNRTRVTAFTRTKFGRTAPTVNLPANLTLFSSTSTPAFNGQPGALGSFTVTATDDASTSLVSAVSSPSGTIFPIGVNTVFVTATDSQNQITSRQFNVTVLPEAPVVKVTSVSNLSNDPKGITFSWTPFTGATAYSVKRATAPGGPYTVISDRQTTNSFIDSGLTGTGLFYIVTAWVNDQEGPASSEIPLAGNAAPFTGQFIGTAASGQGFYNQGNSYLLTFTAGQIGGSNDQMPFLSLPWSGDGSFTTRLVSVTGEGGDVSQFGSYGITMRDGITPGAIMASSAYNTYVNPLALVSRASLNTSATSAGPFAYTNIATPIWLRLTRSGNSMTASYSNDGTKWTQTATSVSLNLPASTLVGLAGGGQNTTLTSTLFDNVVFLGTPVATIEPGLASLSWQSSPGLTFTVERAASSGGPFTVLASGQSSTTFTDPNVSVGTTSYYRVSTSGELGGASVSPVVGANYPNPVTAPTGLSLTPGLGQIALAWNADAPDTNPTYSVLRATSTNGSFVTVASGLTTANYTDSGFINGTTYFYRIVADNGVSTATSTVSSSTSTNGTFTKANNTTALDVAGSFLPASIPGSGDVALWNGTYTNGAVSVGSGLSVSQIQITSPSIALTLSSGSGPIVLGAGGLDLSVATQNLTINAPVTLADNQTWTVAAGRTVTFSGAFAQSGSNRTLALAGAGTVQIAQPFAHTGLTSVTSGTPALTFNFPGAATPFAGPFSGLAAATLRAGQSSSVITLDSTALPSTANVALGVLNGPAGATWILDAAASAIFSASSNIIGLNLTLRKGQLNYTASSGNTDATNIRIEGGSFVIPSGIARYQLGANNQTFQLVGGTADLRNATNYGFRIGGTGSASQSGAQQVTATQTGGSLLAPSASLGGTDTVGVKSPSYTLSGGSFTATGSLTIGADTAGAGNSTFTLSGSGKVVIPTSLSGAQASARQIFAFTGGTLAAATITATNLRSTDAAANGIFSQSGGTLAPGDVGTAGRTAITGAYSLGASGSLAIDLGGTTQANGFQTGQYDYLAVSGTTALAGNLSVNLVSGFTPSNATTFTVVNSTGALSGGFSNFAAGQRVGTSGGQGSFLVSTASNKVTLSDYKALTPLQSWRFANFGDINAPDTADPDGDGFSNLVEYGFGTDPAVSSSAAISYSGAVLNGRGQPTISVTNITNGVDFRAVFGRRQNFVAAGLTYTVQFSANNLATWVNSSATPTVLATDGVIDAVSVPYPLFIATPNGAEKPKFFRVGVSSN